MKITAQDIQGAVDTLNSAIRAGGEQEELASHVMHDWIETPHGARLLLGLINQGPVGVLVALRYGFDVAHHVSESKRLEELAK